MSYTDEEEFYGRVAYAVEEPYVSWDRLHDDKRNEYIKLALAVRAVVYVDPVQEVANKLYAATSTGVYARTPEGNAKGDWLLVARAAIAMGAKP